ncbi:nucleoside-diphosphate sugar epimerase/dehydratase [Betaproteobacteria bacterium LSUCC0117]|nr:nucleoside-diphosphate sugar epimerase/dehydratase [Betaproteobacteria bacterium LSUCC0117]
MSQIPNYLLARSRGTKRLIVLAIDSLVCIASVWLAFYFRLGEVVSLSGPVLLAVSFSIALALPLFIRFGLYRAIFRYSGLPALMAVANATLFYGIVFAAIFTVWGIEGVPRTIGLLQPIIFFLLVGASRATARVWLGGLYEVRLRQSALPRALIYGAGSAGRQLASGMVNSHEIRVIGFLDDDRRLHGQLLNGLRIHDPSTLEALIEQIGATDVLLAIPSASRQRRVEILAQLKPYKLAVRTLPGLNDIAAGRVTLGDVRELDIDDLLGRALVKPNGLLMNMNNRRKTVMVTGAGGSIGAELCRQLLQTVPKRLLLVDANEHALYQVHKELVQSLQAADLSDAETQLDIVPLLASVCDETRIEEIVGTWQPHTVYHAAAYKHVPLVEHNPAEGVHNNVWGTRVCAEAAIRNGVANFVLISTDKAVRPTNIMGATKRLSEMLLQALSAVNPAAIAKAGSVPSIRTVFTMVRFGNVLGSSGSVVPLFREQIRDGGPLTITHPEITRYFMTIPEAAQLVIQAGAMGTGGDVFVLDMGQPVRIIDLARRMVELSGLTVKDELNPSGDIEFKITGLRPGEKLFEELLIGDDPITTQHPRIMKAQEQFLPWATLESKLNTLDIAVGVNDVPAIKSLLTELVTGYQSSGEVVDWVHLAQMRDAATAEGSGR